MYYNNDYRVRCLRKHYSESNTVARQSSIVNFSERLTNGTMYENICVCPMYVRTITLIVAYAAMNLSVALFSHTIWCQGNEKWLGGNTSGKRVYVRISVIIVEFKITV